MMIRVLAVVMLLIGGIIFGADHAGSTVERYQIEVTIVDTFKTLEIKQRLVAEASAGGKIHFTDGGEFSADRDGAALPYGTRLDGSIKDNPGGGKRVELTVEYSDRVSSEDVRTQIVAGTVLKIRTDMVVGESKRIPCGGQRYCVMRLD